MSADLKRAVRRYQTAGDAIVRKAIEYATEQTIEYSRRHPRRRVTFVCAMGATCLHVEPHGGWSGGRDYMLTAEGGYTGAEARMPIPAFITVLREAEHETNIQTIAGPFTMTCLAGEVLESKTEW